MRLTDQGPQTWSTELPMAQALAEAAVANSVFTLQSFWTASLEAEEMGDITRALEIHERILDEVGRSYVAYLRAGWLNYQAGGYIKALEFYEKASRRSPGSVAPLFGAMSCYVAMGDPCNTSRVIKAIIDLDGLDKADSARLAELRPTIDFNLQPSFSPAVLDPSRVERATALQLDDARQNQYA